MKSQKKFPSLLLSRRMSAVFLDFFFPIEMDIGEKLESEDGDIMKHHLFVTVVRQ